VKFVSTEIIFAKILFSEIKINQKSNFVDDWISVVKTELSV
jgi:hypothetical protein